jgi:anti-sigma factor RsiW
VNCQEMRGLVHAYLDGELDLVRNLEMEGHLRDCPTCARALANNRTVQSAFRSGPFYYHAPGSLKARIRSKLGAAKPRVRALRGPARAWMGLAASWLLVFVLGWQIAGLQSRSSAEDLLMREVLSSHVRSLQVAGRQTDVASSNQHTVKPWFQGHLDFSPPVKDLKEEFLLIGGRLDYLGDHPVAALVYKRREHYINLFIWPSSSESDAGPAVLTRQGYHLIHWTDAGLTNWAVSDLNEKELEEFVNLIRS